MKTLPLVALMVMFSNSVSGQEVPQSSEPPDLTVLEKSWSKQVLHPGREPNPLAPNEVLIREQRAQKAEIERRYNDLPNQPTEQRLPTVTPKPLAVRMERLNTWVYRIKVQNTGFRTIRTIFWEYQFLDPETNQVMGNRRITSRIKLLPGKSQVIEYRSTRQPTILVSADSLDRKYRDQFTERLIIHRINYRDGSNWRRRQF